MATGSLKCDNCGAPLDATHLAKSARCEFCHSMIMIRHGEVVPQARHDPPKAAEAWQAEPFTNGLKQARSRPPLEQASGGKAILFLGSLAVLLAVLFIVQPAIGLAFLAVCGLLGGTFLCVWGHHRNRRS